MPTAEGEARHRQARLPGHSRYSAGTTVSLRSVFDLHRRLGMPRKHPQVLGVDLNCSESRIAETMLLSEYAQGDWEGGMFPLAPEVLEPVRRQFGVAHRVLDVLVPEPCLQRPGVVAGVGQRVAATMAQHVCRSREFIT